MRNLLFAARTVLLLLGTSCAGGAQAQPLLTWSLGESHDGQVAGALSATLVQFCGPSRCTWAPDTEPLTLPQKSGPDDIFDLGNAKPYHRAQSQRFAIGLRLEQPLTPHVAAIATMSAALAHSRYRFPDGLTATLTDPAQVSFSSFAVDPAIGLEWRPAPIAHDRMQLRYGLALGREFERIDTRIRSALLDVRNLSTQSHGYVEISAAVSSVQKHPGSTQMAFVLSARGYGRDRLSITSSLRFYR